MSCVSVAPRLLWIMSDGGTGNRIATVSERYYAASVPAGASENKGPLLDPTTNPYPRPGRTLSRAFLPRVAGILMLSRDFAARLALSPSNLRKDFRRPLARFPQPSGDLPDGLRRGYVRPPCTRLGLAMLNLQLATQTTLSK